MRHAPLAKSQCNLSTSPCCSRSQGPLAGRQAAGHSGRVHLPLMLLVTLSQAGDMPHGHMSGRNRTMQHTLPGHCRPAGAQALVQPTELQSTPPPPGDKAPGEEEVTFTPRTSSPALIQAPSAPSPLDMCFDAFRHGAANTSTNISGAALPLQCSKLQWERNSQ